MPDGMTDVQVDSPETTNSVPISDATTLSQVHTFLSDPAVKDAPAEKKRAFLQTKGITQNLIDQVVPLMTRTFTTDDFALFAAAPSSAASAQTPPTSSAPPIITYPEFLVRAHQPTPLITPARVTNAAYVLSGLAAVIYGTSKFLVEPMLESLTEARHDFASHSQSKLDDFNDRLEGLVSKLPEPPEDGPRDGVDVDDDESVTSDPTELYHRDMGTQTSALPSPLPLSNSTLQGPGTTPTVERQTTALSILMDHLSDMTDGLETTGLAQKDRQESVNKLRSSLDLMLYGTPSGLQNWTGLDGVKPQKSGQEDAVEELKREIRGVKGVLLGARRFPIGAGVRAK